MSGETEQNVSGWTVDTLHIYMARQMVDLRAMLDERYATQTKALDAAFTAQQTAMQTAFMASDKAVQAALSSAEKAVTKAELTADKRAEGQNEFRAQLTDQAATFLTRNEFNVAIKSLNEKVDDLKNYQAAAIAQSSQLPQLEARLGELNNRVVGLSESRSALAGQASGTNLEQRLEHIAKQMDANSTSITSTAGRSSGINAGWIYLLGGIAALGTIVSIILVLIR